MNLKTKNEVIDVLARIENRIMKYQQEKGFETIFDFINEDVSSVKERVETASSIEETAALPLDVIMPRISHFTDENGTNVDLNAEGVNVRLKRDGTHEYFRSFGFAGIKILTPVYGA